MSSKKQGNADALKQVRTFSGAKALDTEPDLSGEKVGTRFIASVGQFIARDGRDPIYRVRCIRFIASVVYPTGEFSCLSVAL